MKLTGRQVTVMVVAVCAAAILTPTAVYAVTGSSVNITDPYSASQKARVVGGKLSVGDGVGALSVDGTVRVNDGSGPLTVDGGTIALEPTTAWSAYKRLVNDGTDVLLLKDNAPGARISLGSLTMSRVTGTGTIQVQIIARVPNTAHACSGPGSPSDNVLQLSLGADETRTVTWAPRLKLNVNASQETCLIAFLSSGGAGDLVSTSITGATY